MVEVMDFLNGRWTIIKKVSRQDPDIDFYLANYVCMYPIPKLIGGIDAD